MCLRLKKNKDYLKGIKIFFYFNISPTPTYLNYSKIMKMHFQENNKKKNGKKKIF